MQEKQPKSQRARHVARVAELERESDVTSEVTSALGTVDEPGITIPTTTKPRIVVLGSGWGAVSFVKALTKQAAAAYDVVLLSPRNYFLYTPLLPAVATGTMEERSIVEPIRNVITGKGRYFEAVCQAVDPKEKTIVACFPKDAGFPDACFKMEYDHLIVSVGSVNNTFGIKGVQEHCFFFKGVRDAVKLRRQISECFERAALPYTTPEERKRLLSFVIVGGGPTGVEVAAELHDMCAEDLKRLYPDIVGDVRIRVIELLDYVLSTYDRKIGEYTAQLFQRSGIDLVLNSRVTGVEAGAVTIVNKAGDAERIPFGACVWATGVAKNPLVQEIQGALPQQDHFRALLTDERLRVLGSGGSIWAIGDAATIYAPRALDYAAELFAGADADGNGQLSLAELRGVLEKASKRFPQFEEHARFLNAKTGGTNRFGGLVRRALAGRRAAGAAQGSASERIFGEVTEDSVLSREEFQQLLKTIDLGLRALPATAQVARQQGEWLARLFASYELTDGDALPAEAPDFHYSHKGALAYVGRDRAVMDVPRIGPLWGLGAGFVWKGFETYSQFSLRNKALVSIGWLRTKLFGRDISRV